MDATLSCGRPQKRPQKRPQLEFLRIFVASAVTARAVKGGEAEAPDVSAPSLEGPGTHLDTMEFGRPPGAGLDAPLSAVARERPACRALAGNGRCAPKVQVCASNFWALSAIA